MLCKECKWYQTCPMKLFYQQGLVDRAWIEKYCYGNWEKCVRFQMEEKQQYHPDYMLPDGTIDEGLKEAYLRI